MRNKLTGVRLVGAMALVGASIAVTGCSDDEPLNKVGAGGSGTSKGGTGGSTAGSGGAAAGSGGAAAGSGGAAAGSGGAAAGSGGSAGATGGSAGASGVGGSAGKGGSAGGGGAGASGGSAGASGGSAGASGGSAGASGGSAGASGGGAGGSTGALIDPSKTKTLKSPAVTLFDAAPSNDGATVFFTGILADGNGAVFSGPAAGGEGTRLGSANFAVPAAVALSTDGATLYVADIGGADDAAADQGRVFAVATAGGAAAPVAALDGFAVRGITVRVAAGKDELVFAGTDKTTGAAGIYKVDPAAGVPTLLTSDVREPSGLTTVGELVFVIDAGTSTGSALVTITGANAVTRTALPAPVGFPAGIAAAQGGTSLLISSANTSNVLTFDVAAKTFATTTVALAAGTEGGGLHKANTAAVYALVDGTAGGTGAVYVLTP